MLFRRNKNQIKFTAQALHETQDYGDWQIIIAKNLSTKKEHVILTKGVIENQTNVLCRVASECLPGTALHAATCECKEQLDESMRLINQAGQGIIIYLRQEGRGHGLEVKIKALVNKNHGADTLKAVEMLGLKTDVREYDEAANILKRLKVKSINLITNNPQKISDLQELGINVENRTSIEITPTKFTAQHLKAKQKSGHMLKLDQK